MDPQFQFLEHLFREHERLHQLVRGSRIRVDSLEVLYDPRLAFDTVAAQDQASLDSVAAPNIPRKLVFFADQNVAIERAFAIAIADLENVYQRAERVIGEYANVLHGHAQR